MKVFLALALFAVQANVSSGQSTEPAPRDAGPQTKQCLCAFRLGGSNPAGDAVAGTGILGAIGNASAEASRSRAANYFDGINKEVQQVYEAALKDSGVFQSANREKRIDSADEKPISSTDSAASNKLFECASAKSFWGVKAGWNKRVTVSTKWELAVPGGCKLKFETSVTSDETHGKFPGPTDPALKPAYLDLSKEDAKQFLPAFQKAAKKAGCGE
jgi:hypothetical protein